MMKRRLIVGTGAKNEADDQLAKMSARARTRQATARGTA